MRRFLLALIAVVALFSAFSAPAAIAAPTCQDVHGGTIRCGTPGAMPVGWAMTFAQRSDSDLLGYGLERDLIRRMRLQIGYG